MSIFTEGMGVPEGEVMVQRTRMGVPLGSEDMSAPLDGVGE